MAAAGAAPPAGSTLRRPAARSQEARVRGRPATGPGRASDVAAAVAAGGGCGGCVLWSVVVGGHSAAGWATAGTAAAGALLGRAVGPTAVAASAWAAAGIAGFGAAVGGGLAVGGYLPERCDLHCIGRRRAC